MVDEVKSIYTELECVSFVERQVRVEECRALDVRPDEVAILPSPSLTRPPMCQPLGKAGIPHKKVEPPWRGLCLGM